MAVFTNMATLTYSGGSTNSNVVTGELLEVLSVTKTAILNDYTAGDDVTFVVTIRNTGTTPFTDLTVTDDLGAYPFAQTTLYPLEYVDGSIHYYADGVLQPAPEVTDGPPLVISGISVPAGGTAMLIYEADVTRFAPLGVDDTITNTVSVTGGGVSTELTASETIVTDDRAELTVSKSLSPAVVTENGQLTYTFVIQNSGNSPTVATDDVTLTDVFDPALDPITVTLDGVVLTAGTDYTYDPATGVFATVPGRITVPAATYIQNADGSWTVDPGVAVLTVTGTV